MINEEGAEQIYLNYYFQTPCHSLDWKLCQTFSLTEMLREVCIFVQQHSPGITHSCIIMLSWGDNIERYLIPSGCFLSVKFDSYIKETFVFPSQTHFPSCSNLVNWMLPILFVAGFGMSRKYLLSVSKTLTVLTNHCFCEILSVICSLPC